MRLDGAMALVTGASSGIGAATAAALATAGASLLLSGRDEARLAEVAARTGGTALGGDLAVPGGAAALAEQAKAAAATKGGIDVLVNNAGLGWAGSFGEIPAAKITELATVNLAAPIELTRLLVPGMARSPPSAVPPVRAATSARRASSRPLSSRLAPAVASAAAVAAPIPDEAPVTSATAPLSRMAHHFRAPVRSWQEPDPSCS